jgi:hypothetical protein
MSAHALQQNITIAKRRLDCKGINKRNEKNIQKID